MIGKENQIRGTFSDKWNLLRKCGGIISTKIIFQGTEGPRLTRFLGFGKKRVT